MKRIQIIIIMVIRIIYQGVTSYSFWPKKVNSETLITTTVCQTAPLAKCSLLGSYLFMEYTVSGENAEQNENDILCL